MKNQQYINCYVRIKPLQNQEHSIISSSKREVTINKTKQNYSFTQVFNDSCLNHYIFQKTILPILPSVFQGYNACILAYGQTSSGKTYTMKGIYNDLGVIPLSIKQIFRYIKSSELLAKISISYYQIYNENIIDLLSQQQASKYLQMREDGKKNLVINNLIEQEVKDQFESINFFEKGELKRKFASNNVNFYSSRSHAIFKIMLSSVNSDYQLMESCISMVDLAGSQSVSKTNAAGSLKKQAENINKSLLALSTVIRAITQKHDYVNYRNSKLTRILQPCLSGNSKTIVICTVKQTQDSVGETLNTLKFGVSANSIKMIVRQNIKQGRASQDEPKLRQTTQLLEQQKQASKQLQEQLSMKTNQCYSLSQQNKDLQQQIQELKHHLITLQNETKHHHGMISFLRQQQQKQNKTKSMFFQRSKESIEGLEMQNKNYKISVHNLNEIILKKNAKISALQKNEKSLLDKLQTYEKQINVLQVSASNQEQIFPGKLTQSKKMQIQMPKRQDFMTIPKKNEVNNGLLSSPFTIGTVIKLSTTILTLKIDMNHYLNTISELHQEIQILQQRIQEAHAQGKEQGLQQQNKAPNTSIRFSEANSMKAKEQDRKIKNLQNKMIHLKKQNDMLRRKNAKYIKYLKKCANNNIETINGFNTYLEQNFKLDERALFEALMQENADDFQPFKRYNQQHGMKNESEIYQMNSHQGFEMKNANKEGFQESQFRNIEDRGFHSKK